MAVLDYPRMLVRVPVHGMQGGWLRNGIQYAAFLSHPNPVFIRFNHK
jgi:hypothetical protein